MLDEINPVDNRQSLRMSQRGGNLATSQKAPLPSVEVINQSNIAERSTLINGSIIDQSGKTGDNNVQQFEHAEEDSDDEVIGEGNLLIDADGRTSQGQSDIPQILNDEDMPGGDMLFSLA